jgi:hypothetical protein
MMIKNYENIYSKYLKFILFLLNKSESKSFKINNIFILVFRI